MKYFSVLFYFLTIAILQCLLLETGFAVCHAFPAIHPLLASLSSKAWKVQHLNQSCSKGEIRGQARREEPFQIDSDNDLFMYLNQGIRFGLWKEQCLNWTLDAQVICICNCMIQVSSRVQGSLDEIFCSFLLLTPLSHCFDCCPDC